MKCLLVLALFLAVASAAAAPTDDLYQLGPDSLFHPGVPHGKIIGPATLASDVFTNTARNYWIYVPAQYDPATPACLMIFEDGHAFVNTNGQYRIPNVFDNLIYRREMPVTIAVFVNPGHHPNQTEPTEKEWGDRTGNRPLEYNALDDKYARLTCDELLPLITKQFNISPNPEDHAIAGASSGAICAFTVAWHRSDKFRKVISLIGSFTALRGGDAYPDIILTNEPKPIRIFLQDGLNDNRGTGRNGGAYNAGLDWHNQNIRMVEALTAKHYDMNYTWGIGSHSGKQGGAIMPEMLRWLWRDYPRNDNPHDAANRGLLAPADWPVTTTNR
jgi:predicted alpha/beta superfamily hydrolase